MNIKRIISGFENVRLHVVIIQVLAKSVLKRKRDPFKGTLNKMIFIFYTYRKLMTYACDSNLL